MCGIAMIIGRHLFEGDRMERVNAALDTISHRGLPGRRNVVTNDIVTMGHVRLPIRGLGTWYDQPIATDDYTGVFVGEIFGIDEVNDAEYVMRLLNDEGPAALSQHDGFWAIAFHDHWMGTTKVLTDHLAIKPLYWHEDEGIIASELRAVINLAHYPLTIDQHYLSNVRKWGYDPSERTPYKEIKRLEAGTCYTFGPRGQLLFKHKYFDLKPDPGLNVRTEVEEAVSNRLVGDVPVATLCSGGLDSTIVSLLAAQQSQGMTVFHINAGSKEDREAFDSIDWPNHVRKMHVHLPEKVNHGLWVEALNATEEPVDLGSVLPQFQLGRALKEEGFNVVLTGDGADELFGGYRRAHEYDSQYSDIFSELVHYHNPRLDKCMMASTVELRSPFMAPNVIRAAMAIPWFHNRQNKEVLKHYFQDLVPRNILERPKVPLKTAAVIQGGDTYRKKVIDQFLKGVAA